MITHSLDENTVVFVFGDHGMTPTGDHGGETSLETDAALLVYSVRPLFDPSEVKGILDIFFSLLVTPVLFLLYFRLVILCIHPWLVIITF